MSAPSKPEGGSSDIPDPRGSTDAPSEQALVAAKTRPLDEIVTCDACPVLCRIRPGKTGACDRYGNVDGRLARLSPLVVTQQTSSRPPGSLRMASTMRP